MSLSREVQYWTKVALNRLRTDDFLTVLSDALAWLVVRCASHWYFRVTSTYLRLNGHPGIGDPTRIFYVPPELITHGITSKVFDHSVPRFGICEGDWDDECEPLAENTVFDMFIDHFENDVPWESTDLFKTKVEKIEQGESLEEVDVPSDQQSVELYRNYLNYFDDLYANIKRNGYMEQSNLSTADDFLNRDSPNFLNEIQVCVDRNGRLIVNSGYHRLFIAKIQDIDRIPVRTQIRHTEWQAVRDEIADGQRHEALSKNALRNICHPELRDIL